MAGTISPFRIINIQDTSTALTFTAENIDVSLINALRRIILADIETVAFKTSPHDQNRCNVILNTIAGVNDEIIKERLAGVPIHITDIARIPLQNYLLEVRVENTSDTLVDVTSGNFRIKNVLTGDYLSATDTRNIFPPDAITGDYLHFLRLKPKLADTIPGEAIHLTCEFSIERVGTNGSYIAASTCAYRATPDPVRGEQALAKQVAAWRESGEEMTREQLDMRISNWKILDGMRVVVPNSFDFVLESIGVFSNRDLIRLACKRVVTKMTEFTARIEAGGVSVVAAETTIPFCFDIRLEHGEDHTYGIMLEKTLYQLYAGVAANRIMTYVGFFKANPHDEFILIRLAYVAATDAGTVLQHLGNAAARISEAFVRMGEAFGDRRPAAAAAPRAPTPRRVIVADDDDDDNAMVA